MIFQTAGSNATQVVEDVEALLEEVRARTGRKASKSLTCKV